MGSGVFYFSLVLTATDDLQYYPIAVRAENKEEAEKALRKWDKRPAKRKPHLIQFKPNGFRGINTTFKGNSNFKCYPKRRGVVSVR